MNTFSSEQHVDLGIWNQTQWMPRSKRLSMLVAIFFVFVFYAISSFAQGTAPAVFNGAGDETQVPMPGSGHDYQQLLGETVNLSNGSVSFKISFPQPKARGITLPYAWTYSSAGVNPLGFEGGNVPIWGEVNYTALSEWNTNFGIPSATASAWSVPSFYTGPDNNEYIIGCNYQSGMTFTDPSGVLHNLPITPPAGPVSSETGNNIGHICGTVPQPYVGPAGDSQVVGIPDPQTGYFLAGTTTPEPDDFAVMDKSGTMYLFSASSPTLYLIEDKNGNQITIPPVPASAQSTTPVGYTLFTDTAGRPGPSITGQQKFVYTTSSTSQTTYLPSAITVDNQNYAATWSTVNVDYTIALGGIGSSGSGISCAGTIPTTVTGTRYVMTSLTLPNGQKYQFSYNNPYGLISEIIFPDGGWTQYTWQLSSGQNEIAFWAGYYDNEGAITPLGYGCGSLYQTPVLASRTVSFDGTTVAQSQSYSYTTNWASTDGTISGWSTKTTTATATDEKVGLTASAVYTYLPYSPAALQSSGGATAPSIPLEFTIQSFDWGVNPASGTPLQTVEKTWIDQFELASETTTITATGETAGTIYTYGSPTSGVSTVAAFSDMLEKDEYDYGSGQLPVPAVSGTVFAGYPSSTRTPTRKTFYNYTCCATIPTSISNYLNYTGPYTNRPAQTPALTVPPLLSSEVVENASGTIVAATQYGYDNYSSGSLSAVTATQHDSNYSTSMTARGNLTSVTRCTTLPTTTTGACSVGPTTTYNYDITGQPSSMTDACGNGTCSDVVGTSHTTTFSFSDSPAGGNSYGNSNAYLTNITYPTPANGVAHQENFQYNYTLGYLTQSSDENSQLTKYYYNSPSSNCTAADGNTDGMDRLSYVLNPDGGETDYCYNDAAVSETTKTLITSTPSVLRKTTVTSMDGMGHTVETQLTSDVNVDVVNTTYDGEGHVLTVTNPHWTTSTLPTDGTTTNYYDGLGRKIETVEPDGNKVQTCYNGVASIPAVSNCNAQLGSATTGTWVDSAD
jgi:YD repeat-containing protein